MCIDYRALNAKTQKNAYPLPRIQECIDRLGKASNLSSVDLLSGYWQIRLSQDAVAKTAFNTRHGKYEFLVMPFGLTNAPATFQTLMNSILRPYIDKFVLVYLDDILIYSNSEEEHIEHLRLVFEALRGVGLFARPLKCTFNKPTVEFCGHIFGQGVVRVVDSKVHVIQEWPRPKTVHDVRQFYRLCNYYRRFIRGFSAIDEFQQYNLQIHYRPGKQAVVRPCCAERHYVGEGNGKPTLLEQYLRARTAGRLHSMHTRVS